MNGAAPEVIYRFGSYELHPNRRQLLDNGRPVAIGQRAFDVLTTLVERAGELVTKEELLQRVWPGLVVEENNLQVQVSALRKVLGTHAIVTTAARGYRFTLELGGQMAKVAAAPAGAAELIAVLPLENLSGQQEEYFADGMTEALITDLAKVGGLRVISRSSVMRFKGSKEPLAKIGRALGASAVVEGSVLRSGHRVRISARLVRAETDEYLWAERYDGELADVLGLQDQVARAIARAIGQTLRPMAVSAPRRVDHEVYLLDLQARHLTQQRNEAGYRTALKMFEEAVAKDPTYAPAYVGIADSLNNLANHGFVPEQHVRARSLAAVRRALELDETSAEAHRVLAFCESNFDWARAIAEYERALELNPYSSSTYYWFGSCLAVVGHFERAHEMLRRAHELDPLSLVVPTVQGLVYSYARRFEEALPFFSRVLRIDPDFHPALRYQGEVLVELHRYEEGISALTRSYELGGKPSRHLGYLGYAYARAGQIERARQCLDELDTLGQTQHVPPYFPALVLSGLEEHEAALDRLEQGHAVGDQMLRDYLKVDPQWDKMRGLPRFQALMRKMAYPEAPSQAADGP
jgi:TolB-like protein/Tfp pilus assembly protein PilF